MVALTQHRVPGSGVGLFFFPDNRKALLVCPNTRTLGTCFRLHSGSRLHGARRRPRSRDPPPAPRPTLTGSGAAKSFTPSRRARPRGDSATPDTRRPRLRVTVRGTAACEREPKRSSIKILGYRKNSAYFIYKSRNIQANATGSHTPLDLQRQPLDEAGPWIRGPGRGRHHNN